METVQMISQAEIEEVKQTRIIKEKLKNRYWRLNNLYWIKNKKGERVRFKFNLFQKSLWDKLWYFNLTLKARQLGITTFFAILYLDAVLFKDNQTAGIIAHRKEDAGRIFGKVKFAFDNLPIWLKDELEVGTDSKEELSFKNGSGIFVSTSTRSGTIQFLHISEFGYICKKYPEKAEEIVTGAINSVERGQMVSIESTAKGSSGYFYDFVQQAILNKKQNKTLNEFEFEFFFFAWWENSEYVLTSDESITKENQEYFEQLEKKEAIFLSREQKQWYQAKRKTLKEKMLSEYPSTPEEAFLVSVEGAYYSKQIARAYEEKRIINIPHEKRAMVDTWWDLGRDDYNVILFTQDIGKEIRFIDLYYSRGEGLAHYVGVMQEKREKYGYIYRNHYLPWDVEIKELSTNKSRKETLSVLGLTGIIVVPKLGIEEGIEMTRAIFNKFWFDQSNCDRLVQAIINYRHEWDEKLGVYKSSPLHDEHSHFADTLRSVGVMWRDKDLKISEEDKLYDRFGIFPQIG